MMSMKNSDNMTFVEYERKPLLDSDILEITYAQKMFQNIQILSYRGHYGRKLKWIEKIFIYTTSRIRTTSVKRKHKTLIKKFLKLIYSTLPSSLKIIVIQSWNNIKNYGKPDILSYSRDLGLGIPTSIEPKVSIIIPVHNEFHSTLRCLVALIKNLDQTPYEIILVDDASSDETLEGLRNMRGIRIIHLKKNLGYLAATNFGANFAKSDFLVLLNNDTEPISGWLDSLFNQITNEENIAIVGSKLIYPNGDLQEAGAQVFENASAWNLGRYSNPFDDKYGSVREVDYCSGASIIVRKKFWDSVNGYDPRYIPAYYEDTDLCMQAWKNGYRVVFEPMSCVIHHEGTSHGININSGVKKHQLLNKEKFQEKWKLELSQHWKDSGKPRYEYLRESKGIIVVCDHQFPSNQRDSGSIRCIQLMKMFSTLGFHVVLSGIDPNTSENDLIQFRKSGIEIQPTKEKLINSLKGREDRIKLFWISREEVVEYFFSDLSELNPGVKIVADFIDLNYSIIEGQIVINPKQLEIAKKVSQVVLVSKHEAEILRSKTEINIISTIWKKFDIEYETNPWDQRSGLLFVGGFRHLPNLEGLEWFSSLVLPKLRAAGFSDEIRIIGSGLTNQQMDAYQNIGLEILGRQENLSKHYNSTRLVISPILSGKGLKGKIGEAFSFGVPTITTTIGAEGFDIENGREIIIADDASNWVEKILEIYHNESSWIKMSENSREYCQINLSEKKFKSNLESIIAKVVKK